MVVLTVGVDTFSACINVASKLTSGWNDLPLSVTAAELTGSCNCIQGSAVWVLFWSYGFSNLLFELRRKQGGFGKKKKKTQYHSLSHRCLVRILLSSNSNLRCALFIFWDTGTPLNMGILKTCNGSFLAGAWLGLGINYWVLIQSGH